MKATQLSEADAPKKVGDTTYTANLLETPLVPSQLRFRETTWALVPYLYVKILGNGLRVYV